EDENRADTGFPHRFSVRRASIGHIRSAGRPAPFPRRRASGTMPPAKATSGSGRYGSQRWDGRNPLPPEGCAPELRNRLLPETVARLRGGSSELGNWVVRKKKKKSA